MNQNKLFSKITFLKTKPAAADADASLMIVHRILLRKLFIFVQWAIL